jgi:endonuclease
VRLVIALCTVDYLGRLTAHLPSARRLLLMKADGSVSVHADDRAYKPLNWMSPPCRLSEEHNGPMPVWVVENKAGEQLRITIESIEHDSSHDLGDAQRVHRARLVEHATILDEPKPMQIKGTDTPVPARRLLAIGDHAPSRRSDSTLVGRKWEISTVTAILDETIGGAGCVVNIMGPGHLAGDHRRASTASTTQPNAP